MINTTKLLKYENKMIKEIMKGLDPNYDKNKILLTYNDLFDKYYYVLYSNRLIGKVIREFKKNEVILTFKPSAHGIKVKGRTFNCEAPSSQS